MKPQIEIPKIYHKHYGGEEWLCNTQRYCGKILTIKQKGVSSIHKHKDKEEHMYCLEGRVLLEFIQEEDEDAFLLYRYSTVPLASYKLENCVIMTPGLSVGIAPGIYHRFIGLLDSKILETSTPHSEEDVYRLTTSELLDNNSFDSLLKKIQ